MLSSSACPQQQLDPLEVSRPALDQRGYCYGGKRWEGSLYRGDLELAKSAGVNSYVATPSGSVMGFDFNGMSKAMRAAGSDESAYLPAENYFLEVK